MPGKFEIDRSPDGGCCVCSMNERELYLVRDASSGRLVEVCSYCLLERIDDFVLDNTRPWPGLERS